MCCTAVEFVSLQERWLIPAYAKKPFVQWLGCSLALCMVTGLGPASALLGMHEHKIIDLTTYNSSCLWCCHMPLQKTSCNRERVHQCQLQPCIMCALIYLFSLPDIDLRQRFKLNQNSPRSITGLNSESSYGSRVVNSLCPARLIHTDTTWLV